MTEPICPRCSSDRLRRDIQRIRSRIGGRHYATGGWYICLECPCAFDGVTDHDDGVLPWWVEKRAAGRVWSMAELESEEET